MRGHPYLGGGVRSNPSCPLLPPWPCHPGHKGIPVGWWQRKGRGQKWTGDISPLRCAQPTQLGELTPQLLEGSLDMAFGNVCLHVNTCVTWIQSLAPSKPYPHRPASLLARSALCGDGEGRAPRALAGHSSGGADSWQISLLLAPAPQEAACRQWSESSRPDRMEGGNSKRQ